MSRTWGLGRAWRKTTTIAFPLVAMALALAAYANILPTYFTAADTFRLIEANRIKNIHDLWHIVTSSLMGEGFFYRPLTNLSFALDFAIWGLNPFGYHLTDLLLHASATGAACLLISRITGSSLTGFVGAVIFGLHPELVESVPAVARRQDILAAVFGICSLLGYLKAQGADRRTRRRWWAPALVCFLAAVGGKEIGILVVPVAWVIGWWASPVDGRRNEGLPKRMMASLASVAPYIMATVAYLCVRVLVLGGLGGYAYAAVTPLEFASGALNIAERFSLALAYPTPFFGEENQAAGGFVLVCAAAMMIGATLVRELPDPSQPIPGARRSILGWLVILAMPLVLFVASRTYHARDTYFAVIPFSGLLADAIVASAVTLFASGRHTRSGAHAAADATLFVVAAILATSLVGYSPLLVRHTRWESSGEVGYQLTQGLDRVVDTLDSDTTLLLRDFPRDAQLPQDGVARARFVTFHTGASLTSWLRITRPNLRIMIRPENVVALPKVPSELHVVPVSSTGGITVMAIVPDYR